MLAQTDKQALEQMLGPRGLTTDPVELVTYELDAGMDRGTPDAVAFPESPQAVAQLARWANEHKLAVVARGAGTGLSGGAVAERGGIVIEFSRMDHIRGFDASRRRAQVEPGVINLTLDERARREGLYFPPDPSSQRASTIGGNVAGNAGGPHCFKYGVTTNYVQALDIVLGDGTPIHLGSQATDHPQYDLAGLVVGSQGTLALITGVTLGLVRNPPGVKTMMAAFDTLEQSGAAVSALIAAGLVPATMELIDQNFCRIIEAHAHAGIPTDAGAVIIIEVDGYPAGLDPQMDEIAQIIQQYGARNLRIAQTAEERDKIWYARKSAAGALSRLTPAQYLLDITVPRSRLAETIAASNEICARWDLAGAYALHAGDGNLHPVLLIPRPGDRELLDRVHRAAGEIVALAVARQGSLTGEHGVGIEKREFMPAMHNPAELSALWDVKQVFDPDNRLNPGKVFPTTMPPLQVAPAARRVEDRILAPASISDAAEILTALTAQHTRVRITGAAEPEPDADAVQLSTAALAGIKDYAPADLYVTVGAGTRIADLAEFLGQDGKEAPLASPWARATVGGVVAANANAPLRMRYGGLRDLVLAMTVVLADGRIIRAGRPVIKNVAGYDLPKVLIGSCGTLGLIADVTLKLTPRPRTRRSLRVRTPTLADALRYANQVRPLALVASAILVYNDGPSSVLLYTAEGIAQDVQAELDQVRAALAAAGANHLEETAESGTQTWTRILDRESGPAFLVRVGIGTGDMASYLAHSRLPETDQVMVIDIAGDILYLASDIPHTANAPDWLETVRRPAVASGGYALIMDAPSTSSLRMDYSFSALNSGTRTLMRRLRARWDPAGILHSELFGLDSSRPHSLIPSAQ